MNENLELFLFFKQGKINEKYHRLKYDFMFCFLGELSAFQIAFKLVAKRNKNSTKSTEKFSSIQAQKLKDAIELENFLMDVGTCSKISSFIKYSYGSFIDDVSSSTE